MRTKSAVHDPAGVALFGQLRGQVLALLYGAPDSRLYLREMARITGASPGALQRETKLLVDAGLLLRERRGRQVFYRANSSAPVFHDLSGVIRKTMSVEDTLRSALSSLADRLKAAVIFGSMARDDPGPDSDIDLLVVGNVEASELLELLRPVEQDLGREINAVAYLSDEYRRRRREKSHLVTSVARGPHLNIIGSLDQA